MLTIKQCPWTGPYASTATKLDHEGPTVEALKRALARLDFIPWKGEDFTEMWPAGGVFDKGFRKWQLSRYMPADGIYGQQAWKVMRGTKIMSGPKKGQYALDPYARSLIQKDWAAKNVPDEADFRAQLTAYCLAAEKNEDAWHYVQYRPVDVTVEPTSSYVRADCSSYVIMAYHWAMVKSGLTVPDPSKQGWTGYGNTDMYESDHPRVTDFYKVGDLAHYPGHVTLCRRPGTATTAVFSSHGQEAGPIPTSIHYRTDFRFVCRPPLMP